jgi:hypothetical protein
MPLYSCGRCLQNNWKGGWVVPIVGPDTLDKKKSLSSARNRTAIPRPFNLVTLLSKLDRCCHLCQHCKITEYLLNLPFLVMCYKIMSVFMFLSRSGLFLSYSRQEFSAQKISTKYSKESTCRFSVRVSSSTTHSRVQRILAMAGFQVIKIPS